MKEPADIAPRWQKILTLTLSAIYFAEAALLFVLVFVGWRVVGGPDGRSHMTAYFRPSGVNPWKLLVFLAIIFALFAGTRWAAGRDRAGGLMLLAILVLVINLLMLLL